MHLTPMARPAARRTRTRDVSIIVVMADPMDERHEADVRASSDRMLDVLDRLRGVEVAKRKESIGSATFIRLAEEAESLARIVFRWSQLQEQLARQAAVTGASERTIEQVPPRPLASILAEWREAEFRLQLAKPGTAEAATAVTDLERLREEYRRAAEGKMDPREAPPA
jgi:hypothetical protein